MIRKPCLIGIFVLFAFPAAADLKADCIDSPTPAEGIAACTQRIETETLEADQLSLAYSNRAAWYWETGEMEAANADATKAMEIDPENWRAYLNRARVFHDAGAEDRAIADYDHALSLDIATPYDLSYVLIDRGNLYFNREDYDRALVDYEAALAADEDAVAHSNIGIVHYRKGRYEQSVASHNKALALDPDYEPSYTGRGEALEGLGQFDAAMADYIRAMDLNPDWVPDTKGYMAGLGFWDGPIDGIASPEFIDALKACTIAPEC